VKPDITKPIIFFDGVCGLCNRFVDFIIKADKRQQFLFAPLQGKTFKLLIESKKLHFPDSVVLYTEEKFDTKSSAALKIISSLGGIYATAKICYLLPKWMRDKLYDYVAKNRYQWFGKKETCRLPNPEERARFLE
jgi:predicted DCC family thiol-disulfide oxidoreductase YuxK